MTTRRVLVTVGVARIERANGADALQLLRDDIWLPARALDDITQREATDAALAWDQARQQCLT